MVHLYISWYPIVVILNREEEFYNLIKIYRLTKDMATTGLSQSQVLCSRYEGNYVIYGLVRQFSSIFKGPVLCYISKLSSKLYFIRIYT